MQYKSFAQILKEASFKYLNSLESKYTHSVSHPVINSDLIMLNAFIMATTLLDFKDKDIDNKLFGIIVSNNPVLLKFMDPDIVSQVV